MLRSILIGLDSSIYSKAAVALGVQWGRRFDALLVGLGIVDEPSLCRREPLPIGAGAYKQERDRKRLVDARRRVDRLLEQFVERCQSERIRCEVLAECGSPCAQILREARLRDALLLGQHTYFHVPMQDGPDETLRDVLRESSRPVVTVPAAPIGGAAVVVAFNGSPQADRALQAFVASGLSGDDEVHVLSVDPDLAAAARMADQAACFLSMHGIKAVACPSRSTARASEAILSQVDAVRASLLVMGAYGRSAWREIVFGSTTTRVLDASPVPVFFCH